MVEITNGKALTLTEIQVAGFKSLRDRVSVELGALTLLAGANSSGKSSLMQPVLLLKQTFEQTYDPGALWLGGPNAVFSSIEQIFWTAAGQSASSFAIKLNHDEENQVEITFEAPPAQNATMPIEVATCVWQDRRGTLRLKPEMSEEEIAQAIETYDHPTRLAAEEVRTVERHRSYVFLMLNGRQPLPNGWHFFATLLESLIHVPGLRGNPERTYKRIGGRTVYPGLFPEYVASTIFQWQQEKSEALLAQLGEDLYLLGLTDRVEARALGVAELELQVGRLKDRGAQDMVSIADVGFGVSQVLPVIVALLAAKPGQMVYLEQPEIHLHPRAQVALAEVVARAIRRGVQVIVETHSELFLLGIQRLVASGDLSPEQVKLHWFTRDVEGVTRVTSAALNAEGAFGQWPVDFSDVSMQAMRAYMEAAMLRRRGQA